MFEELRAVLKDPAIRKKKFNLENEAQVFAANKWMKSVILNMGKKYNNDDDTLGLYRDKMASNRRGLDSSVISEKNLILMQNDPVQRLESDKVPSNLDIILAHTHFKEPKNAKTPAGLAREQAREIYRDALTGLWESQNTRHIIDALAALIEKEKGEFIFNASSRIGTLGIPYRQSADDQVGSEGFYANRHTIFMGSLINQEDSSVNAAMLGTFIHEAQHFLFNRIVENDTSPVKAGSPEEKLLDESLAKDREYRKTANLSDRSTQAAKTFVKDLESYAYFRPTFDEKNAQHLQTMRVEAIVRIAQLLAEGYTREEVRSTAPNLYDFYFNYSVPMIQKFTEENSLSNSIIQNVSPQKNEEFKTDLQLPRQSDLRNSTFPMGHSEIAIAPISSQLELKRSYQPARQNNNAITSKVTPDNEPTGFQLHDIKQPHNPTPSSTGNMTEAEAKKIIDAVVYQDMKNKKTAGDYRFWTGWRKDSSFQKTLLAHLMKYEYTSDDINKAIEKYDWKKTVMTIDEAKNCLNLVNSVAEMNLTEQLNALSNPNESTNHAESILISKTIQQAKTEAIKPVSTLGDPISTIVPKSLPTNEQIPATVIVAQRAPQLIALIVDTENASNKSLFDLAEVKKTIEQDASLNVDISESATESYLKISSIDKSLSIKEKIDYEVHPGKLVTKQYNSNTFTSMLDNVKSLAKDPDCMIKINFPSKCQQAAAEMIKSLRDFQQLNAHKQIEIMVPTESIDLWRETTATLTGIKIADINHHMLPSKMDTHDSSVNNDSHDSPTRTNRP